MSLFLGGVMKQIFSFFIIFNFFFLTVTSTKDELKSVTKLACKHYKAIIAIEALLSSLSKGEARNSETSMLPVYFENGPNPYYNQTEQGLYCTFEECLQPSYLLTPWGEISLKRKDFIRTRIDYCMFLKRLKATFCSELSFSRNLIFLEGPIAKINQVENMILPEPKIAYKKDFFTYEESVKAWKKIGQKQKNKFEIVPFFSYN